MNEYEQRRQARADRLQAAADKARKESTQSFDSAHAGIAGIPAGQPILVGHHSERRHRRDLERHDNRMRRGIELGEQADDLERRAGAAASNTSISSDDPDAIQKLRERIAELEAERDMAKQVNAAYKRGGWDEVIAIGTHVSVIERCKTTMRFSSSKRPYPGWSSSNRSAEIRRLKQRILTLEEQAARTAAEPYSGTVTDSTIQWTVEEHQDENRIWICFDRKPPKSVTSLLGRWGFRWSRTRPAWVRNLNSAGIEAAKLATKEISK